MPFYLRNDRDPYWTSAESSLSLSDYNSKNGMDFSYNLGLGRGSAWSQWYYRTYYKPEYDSRIASMHSAQAKVGIAVLAFPAVVIVAGEALPVASLAAAGIENFALTQTVRLYLNYQIATGSVVGGSGTTVLLGRYMDKVINPEARSLGYTTITNSLPSFRSLTMHYNAAWLNYHMNASTNILMHINSNSGSYSPYMQMEIRMLLEFYR